MDQLTEQDREKQLDEKIREAAGQLKIPERDVLIVPTDVEGAEVVAFRVPTRDEWRRYRSELMSDDPSVKAGASVPLVQTCCFYPPAPEFKAIIESHPGLVETYSAELIPHAGVGRAKKARKL